MPSFHIHPILRAAELELVRYGCDGRDPPRPVEEVAGTDVLMLPVRGRFVVRSAAGRTVLDPGRGLLLRAGDRYTIRHPGGGDDCLAVRGPMIARLDRAPVVPIDVTGQLALLGLGPDATALAAEEAVVAVTSGRDHVAGGPADRTIAARIGAHLAEHFDQPLRLADVARAAGVSPFHASRAFRRATGRSIHQHHEDIRLRHALALVLDTRRPLAEIAAETGFANQGHLGNRFRRRFATSPGRARGLGPRASGLADR